jgi:uncharacterized protein YbjQ (UPF0145 family)
MPLFHRKTEEEKQQDEERRRQEAESQTLQQTRFAEEQATREASLASLQRGGIPIEAQRRLDDLRQRAGSFFTSDLTVNEFLLARQSGLEPLSQVMGCSIYHVGWQRMPGSSYFSNSQELRVVSEALNHARVLALGRLSEEAQRVGAHAVIGVHVNRSSYDWGTHLIEFNAVGTAVRVKDAPLAVRPGLTNLSGQDFWKLHQSGYWPLGVVAASMVYYVVAGWQTWAAGGWARWYNQELGDFTQGLYTARHLCMGKVWEQASELGGIGIVGMQIEQSEDEYEVETANDQRRQDMIFTFHAIGTAIGETSDRPRVPTVYAGLSLKR